MKSYYIILFFCFFVFYAYPQEASPLNTDLKTDLEIELVDTILSEVIKIPSNWKFDFEGGLTGSQAYYSNWAAGGENAISARLYAIHGGIFQKQRNLFNYRIDFAIGYQWLVKNRENPLNKTDDKMVVELNYGYKIDDKYNFFYSAFVNFRSQFANGVDSQRNITSSFLSPAYLTYGVGVEYKLKEYLDITLSPIAARNTFVLNDFVWRQANYGITKSMIADGQHVRTELGANLAIIFKKDLAKNINLFSKLNLYSNYLDSPQNVDVNFEVGINFKINKFLSTGIFFNYIYDDDVRFTIVEKGVEKVNVPRGQFKESFYIGLVYKM